MIKQKNIIESTMYTKSRDTFIQCPHFVFLANAACSPMRKLYQHDLSFQGQFWAPELECDIAQPTSQDFAELYSWNWYPRH